MNYWFLPVVGCYLASSAAYGGYLYAQKDRFHRAGYMLVLAGFFIHAMVIVAEAVAAGAMPVQNLHQTVSFAAWILAGTFVLMRLRTRVKILGVIIVPLIALTTTTAFMIPDKPVVMEASFSNIWLILHVVVIFIGEASLALACGTGILYLIQERSIKSKKHRFFYKRLPSLDLLDSTGYSFIVIGFTTLTIGLITGFIYAHTVWGRFWSWDPKEVWSGITWLIYAALLHERLVAGWRGRRAAILAIVGFAAMMFTFFGVNFFLEGHHDEFTRW